MLRPASIVDVWCFVNQALPLDCSGNPEKGAVQVYGSVEQLAQSSLRDEPANARRKTY